MPSLPFQSHCIDIGKKNLCAPALAERPQWLEFYSCKTPLWTGSPGQHSERKSRLCITDSPLRKPAFSGTVFQNHSRETVQRCPATARRERKPTACARHTQTHTHRGIARRSTYRHLLFSARPGLAVRLRWPGYVWNTVHTGLCQYGISASWGRSRWPFRRWAGTPPLRCLHSACRKKTKERWQRRLACLGKEKEREERNASNAVCSRVESGGAGESRTIAKPGGDAKKSIRQVKAARVRFC